MWTSVNYVGIHSNTFVDQNFVEYILRYLKWQLELTGFWCNFSCWKIVYSHQLCITTVVIILRSPYPLSSIVSLIKYPKFFYFLFDKFIILIWFLKQNLHITLYTFLFLYVLYFYNIVQISNKWFYVQNKIKQVIIKYKFSENNLTKGIILFFMGNLYFINIIPDVHKQNV